MPFVATVSEIIPRGAFSWNYPQSCADKKRQNVAAPINTNFRRTIERLINALENNVAQVNTQQFISKTNLCGALK